MNYQFQKSLKTSFETTDDKGGIVARSSSYENLDVYGDRFERGAFDKSISSISKSNKLPMLWQHIPSEPIGHWFKAWDDGEFLYTEGKMSLGIRRADEARINLINGDISDVSIGFDAPEKTERKDANGNFAGFDFNVALLRESSIVTFGANPLAGVSEVKSITRIREFEKSLIDAARDAGVTLSRRDVEKLSQSVWPKLGKSIEREADTDDGELVKALRAFDPLKI